ncbi:MAG: YceI family protein [Bacteroidota bacterium]|nr:YceI family protein [Bacteroidota bacterium]
MKKLLPIFAIFIHMLLLAQTEVESTALRLLPQSKLMITGSTNVNTFHCVFDTEKISGQREILYTVIDQCILLDDLDIRLRAAAFDCGNRRMNEDFCDLLQSDRFPEIRISILKIQPISEQYCRAFVKICLAGEQQQYDLPVLISDSHYQGKLQLNIRDFGLEPPKKALGLIEVDEEIEISFDLQVDHSI